MQNYDTRSKKKKYLIAHTKRMWWGKLLLFLSLSLSLPPTMIDLSLLHNSTTTHSHHYHQTKSPSNTTNHIIKPNPYESKIKPKSHKIILEKNQAQNPKRNQNQNPNAKNVKIKKLRQTRMNLRWVEKELCQILAASNEWYQATMTISIDLCKALTQKPKPLPTSLLCKREGG